jgi:hypothetical protein
LLVVLREPWLLVVVGILEKLRLVSLRRSPEPKRDFAGACFGVVVGDFPLELST